MVGMVHTRVWERMDSRESFELAYWTWDSLDFPLKSQLDSRVGPVSSLPDLTSLGKDSEVCAARNPGQKVDLDVGWESTVQNIHSAVIEHSGTWRTQMGEKTAY